MKLQRPFPLILALALLSPAFASAADEIVRLPEGQLELADLLSPEQLYAEMLGMDESDLDTSDLGAEPTAMAKPESRQTARVYILVSKARQHLWVYIDGRTGRGWDWKVSTGTEQKRCPPAPASCRIARTPTGLRHPGIMDWEHYSSLYGNAPMHRAIQFVGGIFLHATYGDHIPMLGRRDSGGCVRQHPANAEKLFLLVDRTMKQYGRESVVIEIIEE